MKNKGRRHLHIVLAFLLCLSVAEPLSATTISELQEDVKKSKEQLKDAEQQASEAQEAQEGVGAEIEEIDAELVSLITDINLIEEAIAQKEEEIAATQVDYDAAVAEKDEQYAAMKIRIQFMYEKGDSSYLNMFFGAANMGDMVNKAKYVEELYNYDRKLLAEYEATVQRVQELQDTLEEDKSELETSRTELQEGQTYMEELLAKKRTEYENYGVMLTKAKQEAATYTARIKQETAQIRKLEEEERKRREEEERKRKEEEERLRKEQEEQEASGDSGSPTKEEAPKPSSGGGGGKGQQIADYACKFIGNPYVAGGTSLTNGADCSGFVMSVYKNFGISLPRSSYAQSTVGKGVSYSEAKPGDVIYYGGHVGIYIGNGQIVHASTERTGIKITSATYRSIITVRRIV
ncbi:MAG: NlpC/P60 family protein [bacterium]|nr:NlpC/P60 family protein [bacterium]MCM1423692.1 NlpC/P60 family protein [bacterium]